MISNPTEAGANRWSFSASPDVRADWAERTGPPKRFDPETARGDFPALERDVRPGVPLVYLDSAATSLKPWPVIHAVADYLANYPASVHRGLHSLSERATEAFESARKRVAQFLGAEDPAEIVFTRGATESINLVAQSFGRTFLKAGDEIVLSLLEHHANIVPWQMLARERGVVLKFADVTDSGRLDFVSFARLMSPKVRLVAITGMSNVLGTVTPLSEIIDLAHLHGALVLVDGAQSVPHRPPDVIEPQIDFLAFSAHKLLGPTGLGVLYARRELLEAMPPVMGGGGMVVRVDQSRAEWNELPWKFEAGTPPIAEVIGLGAAVDYLDQFDRMALVAHEHRLTAHAHDVLGDSEGVRLFGPEPLEKGGIVAFDVEGVHPHDLATLLDQRGVAIRAGAHCAMPLHDRLGVPATARASFSLYNTLAEVDLLADAIEAARRVFHRTGNR
jgi:cysteine desulfurase/selenocysteine lyase